ncbi:hypothetical protein GCWU000246_00032 [Jonquetella anthropi E3_33 E1]|nr:hypothetical protein GCWU000246_00032 [Jonquetella anthropi E3_33 E1]
MTKSAADRCIKTIHDEKGRSLKSAPFFVAVQRVGETTRKGR